MLLPCNIASAKSICRNGCVLENEVLDEDGAIVQRYWITLDDEGDAV